jgi:hypothetical protein
MILSQRAPRLEVGDRFGTLEGPPDVWYVWGGRCSMAERTESEPKPVAPREDGEATELGAAELEEVAGGAADSPIVGALPETEAAGDAASQGSAGTIMKTKHDTVKNSISNVR